jgi:hypothetical protein
VAASGVLASGLAHLSLLGGARLRPARRGSPLCRLPGLARSRPPGPLASRYAAADPTQGQPWQRGGRSGRSYLFAASPGPNCSRERIFREGLNRFAGEAVFFALFGTASPEAAREAVPNAPSVN